MDSDPPTLPSPQLSADVGTEGDPTQSSASDSVSESLNDFVTVDSSGDDTNTSNATTTDAPTPTTDAPTPTTDAPTPTTDTPQTDTPTKAEPEGSDFECNICLDTPESPVVTLCGHMFCNACIWKWLELHPEMQSCPVCKSGVSHDKLVPIYGRGKEAPKESAKNAHQTPPRPAGQRFRPQPDPQYRPFPFTEMFRNNGGTFQANFVGFPSLFGVGFTFGGGLDMPDGPMTPEAAQQLFISRIMLLAGLFAIVSMVFF